MKVKRGDAGSAVAIVQFALNAETPFTPKLKVDGLFGPRTEARVKEHQKKQKLVPDGIVGPLTLDTLFGIMTLTSRAKFSRKSGPAPSGPTLRPPLGGTPPSPALEWLNPNVAEHLRQQEAFWKWWSGPHPTPTFRPNLVVVPTSTPYGPIYLPAVPRYIDLPGPPAKTAETRVPVEPEGGDFTLGFKSEGQVDVINRKFMEAKYGIGLDWVVLRRRLAEIEIGATLARDHKGDTSGELEVTLSGGSGLTLKQKLGQLGSFKFLPYLSTAVSSELAFEASGGVKAYAEINIAKIGPVDLKATIGVKGGPKLKFGPVETPDGHEEHKLKVYGLAGTGFITFGGEF